MQNTRRYARSAAFTLVELSIVLVIIGLLVGGVLSGQSLIRAAELRAVSSEYQKYTAAVNAFRDKYMAIPGDMNNATQFWGRLQTTNCAMNTSTTATSPGACDGDGNGQISASTSTAGASEETFQFWKQLAMAGIIEGSYTGITATNTAYESVLGTNVPKSKMGNAGWAAYYPSATSGNTFYFGAQTSANLPTTAILKPEEAWNVDTKLDDGNPGTGKVYGIGGGNAGAASDCNATTTTYNLTATSQNCTLNFIKAF